MENQVLHNSKIRLPRRLVHNSYGVHTSGRSYKLVGYKLLPRESSSILKLLAKLRVVTDLFSVPVCTRVARSGHCCGRLHYQLQFDS